SAGASSTERTRRYGSPATTMAASMMHVPPSRPGHRWEPLRSRQSSRLFSWEMPALLLAMTHLLLVNDPPQGLRPGLGLDVLSPSVARSGQHRQEPVDVCRLHREEAAGAEVHFRPDNFA